MLCTPCIHHFGESRWRAEILRGGAGSLGLVLRTYKFAYCVAVSRRRPEHPLISSFLTYNARIIPDVGSLLQLTLFCFDNFFYRMCQSIENQARWGSYKGTVAMVHPASRTFALGPRNFKAPSLLWLICHNEQPNTGQQYKGETVIQMTSQIGLTCHYSHSVSKLHSYEKFYRIIEIQL